MEQLIEFIKAYGWQLTLIAVAGVTLLGILKYCKVFDKFEEKVRHFLYLLISVGLSIIGSVIYLACIHQLDTSFVFTFATAVFSVNQIAYTIYDTTPLRDLLSKLWDLIVEFFNKKQEEGNTPTVEPEPEPEPEPIKPEPIKPIAVPIPTIVTNLVYNGKEQIAVASTDVYTVEGGSATDAGDYEATVTLVDVEKYCWETEFDGVLRYTISKATYDMSYVTFPDSKIFYDGTAHSIFINGTLPENVTVSYTNNNHTDAGEYKVTASFLGDEANYEKIADMSATLTIGKGFPKINAIVDNSRHLYKVSDFPEITVSDDSTPGTITWESGQTLKVGTNDYTWKFTPNNPNYYTTIGASAITVLETVETDVAHTVLFHDGAPSEMKVHLPPLGKATFSIVGTSDYNIEIKSNYGVTTGSVIEMMYYVEGNERPYLPLVDDYVTEFDIDKQADHFVINCTPDEYNYKKLLERKWGVDNVTFSKKLDKEFTYKMVVTSTEGNSVTIYLEQD